MCTIQSTPNPQTIDVATHWVSDGLAPCFQSWIRYNPVLISAQTGQGKNHFIMNTLIPYAAQTGQRVVLLSNRSPKCTAENSAPSCTPEAKYL